MLWKCIIYGESIKEIFMKEFMDMYFGGVVFGLLAVYLAIRLYVLKKKKKEAETEEDSIKIEKPDDQQ
jgi:cadmium resistance protein CadD (predicted permease)